MDTPGTLKELSRRFKAENVAKNPKGFHYVSIDATINRFNEVLATKWAFRTTAVEIQLLPTDEVTYGKAEKPGYLANVSGAIGALGSERAGVGADFADDPDKAIKTAQAEAFKKSGHQFGVGLYLWDARERALVDAVNSGTDLSSLKSAVQLLAAIEGAQLTADGIADHFGLSKDALQDEEVLTGLLANAGLL